MQDFVQLWHFFIKQIIPTRLQILVSGLLSLVVLVIVRIDSLIQILGFSSATYEEGGKALGSRLDIVLGSQLASNIVLVTFWATIGLITYLAVWSVLNALTDIRNEVTIKTAYTNQGHWKGILETVAIKAVVLAVLVAFMSTFKYTFSLWLTLVTPAQGQTLAITIVSSLVAWLGLAIQIYLVIFLVILLVTPWYRPMGFTGKQN
jgi:hypothetical protein